MERDLIGSRIAGGNTAYKRSNADFYPTPPDVTFALLDFLRLHILFQKHWDYILDHYNIFQILF